MKTGPEIFYIIIYRYTSYVGDSN